MQFFYCLRVKRTTKVGSDPGFFRLQDNRRRTWVCLEVDRKQWTGEVPPEIEAAFKTAGFPMEGGISPYGYVDSAQLKIGLGDVGINSTPVFSLPKYRNAAIWRYLSFAKFVAMLESKSLYFARADQFTDKFEGTYQKRRFDFIEDFPFHPMPGVVISSPEDLRAEREKIASNNIWFIQWAAQGLPKTTFVNCWTLSEYESEIMWSLYVPGSEVVAIKSTLKRLSKVTIDRHKEYLPDSAR